MDYIHERNYGCRFFEYIYRGLRTVTMENEKLRISILVDKGSDIFEFLYKPLDVDFMWRSPLGVKDPKTFVPTIASKEGSFSDYYEGGWQELMPSGGRPCSFWGTEFGLHGETPLLAWNYTILEDRPERITLKLWVRTVRTPFYVEKELSLQSGSSVLEIKEMVTNEGEVDLPLFWGHHPALGKPFLSEACVVDLPARMGVVTNLGGANNRLVNGQSFQWPIAQGEHGGLVDLSKIPPPESKSADIVRLTQLEEGWYGITNTKLGLGFGLVWDKEVFPCIVFWQVYKGHLDYPWYGRTYNIALEPWSTSSRTIAEASEKGDTLFIKASASIQTTLKALVYASYKGLKRITPDGRVIEK
ncbi:MAG: DUF4432 family protein [Firmicutes bacterium]|nr:DUF4432 family protein [Bacillota bacterium]